MVMAFIVITVKMVKHTGIVLIPVIKLGDYPQETIISRMRGELLRGCSPQYFH